MSRGGGRRSGWYRAGLCGRIPGALSFIRSACSHTYTPAELPISIYYTRASTRAWALRSNAVIFPFPPVVMPGPSAWPAVKYLVAEGVQFCGRCIV